MRKPYRALTYTILGLAFIAGVTAFEYYRTFYQPNTVTPQGETAYLYVPTGATYAQLADSLLSNGFLKHPNTFVRAAHKENLRQNVHPGRYAITPGMGNKALARTLAMGWQTPLNLTLSGRVRTFERLAAVLSRSIEADSLQILEALCNEALRDSLGFDEHSLRGMFIPNTYEVYWNITPEALLYRMRREYDAFWNEERLERARAIGLTPRQVSTLAAIVYEETVKTDEMPIVAGLYMNRLHKGIPLQADPTLIFAAQDYSIRRVLRQHTKIESPYNTYLNKGLPPGPICVPPISALDAVLHYDVNSYIYMCAKDDFSGYHNFAVSLPEHNRNAKRFQAALTRRLKEQPQS